jgi:hypothetical protein
MSDETKPITTVSPTLHPDSILPFAEAIKDTPAMKAATSALQKLYSSLGDMEAASTTARQQFGTGPVAAGIPSVLPDEIAARLNAEMGARFASTARAFDASMATVTESVDKLNGAIERKLTNSKRDAAAATEAAEIRAYVKAQPDPLAFIHQSIEAGDIAVASAVLATSNWVSGLSRENHAFVRELASGKFCPVETAQRDAAVAVRDHLTRSSAIFVEAYRKMLPPVRAVTPAAAALAKLKGAA